MPCLLRNVYPTELILQRPPTAGRPPSSSGAAGGGGWPGDSFSCLPYSTPLLNRFGAVFAGSGGKYLFHWIGWKGRIWQLWCWYIYIYIYIYIYTYRIQIDETHWLNNLNVSSKLIWWFVFCCWSLFWFPESLVT